MRARDKLVQTPSAQSFKTWRAAGMAHARNDGNATEIGQDNDLFAVSSTCVSSIAQSSYDDDDE